MSVEAERGELLAMKAGAAFLWLSTGALVVFPSYREVGSEHLLRLGLPEWLMFAACALEVAFGVALLATRPAGWQVAAQLSAVAFFTVVLAAEDVWLLVHPMGVLSKNLPFGALVLATFWASREGFSFRTTWLLRAGMAVVWLTEGLFPKILFQQPFELAVVEAVGLGVDAGRFLYVLGAAQLASGLLALTLRGRLLRMVLLAQLLGLVVLPLLVGALLPSLWVHPFGPLTKNVPIIVGTAVLLRRLWRG